MDQHNQESNHSPKFRIPTDLDFEKYFNTDIPSEKIQFAKHYLETKMGYDLNEDAYIDFSAIGIKVFGCMVADIVLEYENYKVKGLDG